MEKLKVAGLVAYEGEHGTKVHDNKIKFACEVCGLEVQANRNVTHNIGFWVLGTFSRPLSNVGGVGHSESGSYDFPPVIQEDEREKISIAYDGISLTFKSERMPFS